MPALSSAVTLVASIVQHNIAAAITSTASSSISTPLATEQGQSPLQVICAWPVSGQYGPGSRILYYVLVAACVFGRGSAWLRGACLAAALLVPAVAALHAIVLASVHVDGAVDMDVFGAFQLCAIGVLAGPVTVKMSGTYFNAPGRNLIFLWTGLILAGLLSLTVELFRTNPVSCVGDYEIGIDNTCGLVCSVDLGPFSPIRGGAQNNIYVIPAPARFSFGAATLLSAACCIPAILSLVSMWNKILKNNWRKLRDLNGSDNGSVNQDQPISGTNAATPRRMLNVNDRITFYLKMVEIPLFGAAIIAILIVGERNFFDPDSVDYQTEPLASVGQWAPMVGTALAAAGSLYAILAAGGLSEKPAGSVAGDHHCTCAHHSPINDTDSTHSAARNEMVQVASPDDLDIYPDGLTLGRQDTVQSMRTVRSTVSPIATRHLRQSSTNTTTRGASHNSNELARTSTFGSSKIVNATSRHKVARVFEKIGDKLGTPAPDAFDDSAFQRGLASDFPEVPGESERNDKLQKIKQAYNPERDAQGLATPLRKQRSRASSFHSVSSVGGASEAGDEPNSPGMDAGPSNIRTRRRATLEVPNPGFLSSPKPRRLTFPSSTTTPPSAGPVSPTIKISVPHETEAETSDTVETPTNEATTRLEELD